MKLKLHGQILIGMVLGILFGIGFPTTYKITDDTISQLESEDVPEHVINILKTDKKRFEETRETFVGNLSIKFKQQTFKKYKNQIIQASKYNVYLSYVSWLGELFVRALSMIIIPLIISSIVSSVANIKESSRIAVVGVKTLFYYLFTGAIAIVIGLIFVHIITPGTGANIDLNTTTTNIQPPKLSFLANFKDIVPQNIFKSIASGHTLSIIFFSLLLGVFTTVIQSNYKKLLVKFFDAFYELMSKITGWIIKFAPLGIFGMMAVIASETDYFIDISTNLAKYIFTVLVSLLFYSAIVLPFILKFIFNVNPFSHYKAVRSALFMAFATSSSGTTLPITMNLVSNKSGVSNRISGFTLPLGTTVNIDGTALYELIAVFFIAQVYGVELSIIEIIIVAATTMLVSIGASSVPMGNIIIMSIILNTVGLPIEGIALIVLFDRFLDMFKSALKVWSDSCGAVIIAKSEGERLKV